MQTPQARPTCRYPYEFRARHQIHRGGCPDRLAPRFFLLRRAPRRTTSSVVTSTSFMAHRHACGPSSAQSQTRCLWLASSRRKPLPPARRRTSSASTRVSLPPPASAQAVTGATRCVADPRGPGLRSPSCLPFDLLATHQPVLLSHTPVRADARDADTPRCSCRSDCRGRDGTCRPCQPILPPGPPPDATDAAAAGQCTLRMWP